MGKFVFLMLCFVVFGRWVIAGSSVRFDFENLTESKRFVDWAEGATGPTGKIARWSKKVDLSTNTVCYGIEDLGKVSDGRFNLTWNRRQEFKNIRIETRFRALSGKVDQGGGLVWRMRDVNNYYVARYNPLEGNFRIYTVRAGFRKVIGTARIELAQHRWHRVLIVHTGSKIEGYLNGRKLLDIVDKTLERSGYVGLWTKADAVTLFQNFLAVEV